MYSNDIAGMIVSVSCCVILPVLVVWLTTRKRINADNNRKEIVLAAIEKDSSIDLVEFFKKTNLPQKLLKEKLLKKLLIGCIFSLLGIVLLILGIYLNLMGKINNDDTVGLYCSGAVLCAIGIAFLINFFVGKKMLAKEIAAEERNKTE